MSAIWQNLRYAARILAKNPGFTLVAVLTLALGIGANTAIFSVVYSALLRPLPYDHPNELITIGEGRIQNKDNEAQSSNSSNPDFQDWKKTAKSFDSLAAYGFDAFTLAGNGEPKNVFATQVTPNFFRTLGVKPVLGRDFVDGEDSSDGPHTVLLTNGFWRSDFGGDPAVIGRTIRLDGKPATIVGVLPANFEFAPTNAFPLWVPMHAGGDLVTRRSLRWLNVVARLKPGVTMQQAQAEMDAITAQLARAYPQFDGSVFVAMNTLRHKIVGKIEPLLFVMFGAVGFVLLIACANVANLMMTRSVSRRKEFAIRTALGATRGQLFAQLLTESLLLALAGAFAGFLAAQWGVSALIAAIPENVLQTLPNLRTAAANGMVLAFLAGIALLTAVLFGMAPGIAASNSAVGEALKDESRAGTSTGQARLRNGLVIAEIAISLVLLVGAGLMLQSLHGLLHQNPGFDARNLLTFSVNLPDDAYPSEKEYPGNNPSAIRFDHEFSQKLNSIPGVENVGMTTALPIGGTSGTIRFVVEGRPTAAGQEDECDIITADAAYFTVLKVPLIQGRFFADTDQVDSPPVVIINQAFVKKYFPNEDPIGKRTRFTFNAKEPYRQIVGVIANVAQDDLAEPPPPVIYYPNDQGPSTYMTFMLRTAGSPAAFIGSAASALHEMDPQLPMIQPKTMDQYTNEAPAVFLRRYPSYLIGSFATLAIVLAMIGLYGLISFTVLQRTREIGIRMALGARPADVLGLVLKQGIGATLVGIAAGIVAGIALTRTMASLLFGVKPTDGLTFACVSLLLIAVAIVASYIPARRAMKTDPLAALRHE
ncbi:MAG TPA: ABC transporter permease [Candidatus Acidoferrales bacterium]